MDVKCDLPGDVEISLELRDLESIHKLGHTIDRAGFSGFESKTWVHMPPLGESWARTDDNHAQIEQGGDLHIHLSRAFLPPVTIEQKAIEATPEQIERYFGRKGLILITIKS